jgi:hypothetical protein
MADLQAMQEKTSIFTNSSIFPRQQWRWRIPDASLLGKLGAPPMCGNCAVLHTTFRQRSTKRSVFGQKRALSLRNFSLIHTPSVSRGW